MCGNAASAHLCWGGGMVLGGRSSLCPRALRDVWLDVVNKEAGPEPLSVKVPMLETDAGVTESDAGLTDTAEPAAAGEREWLEGGVVSDNCAKTMIVRKRAS